jgi:hypothetical protein
MPHYFLLLLLVAMMNFETFTTLIRSIKYKHLNFHLQGTVKSSHSVLIASNDLLRSRT